MNKNQDYNADMLLLSDSISEEPSDSKYYLRELLKILLASSMPFRFFIISVERSISSIYYTYEQAFIPRNFNR